MDGKNYAMSIEFVLQLLSTDFLWEWIGIFAFAELAQVTAK
jgi:hypothetical protein